MSKTILVGYDPRTRDRAPVKFGVAAARFTGAPLIVAVAQSGPEGVAAFAKHLHEDTDGHVDEDLLADCSEAVEEVEYELRTEGIRVACRQIQSTSAARALHQEAEREDAGLLVVGSSRRSAVGRTLLGSTAERLLHGCPCPVVVVPAAYTPSEGGPSTIAVAYVDTPEGREALRGAHALARRAGATLKVFTVVKHTAGMHLETEPSLIGQAQAGKNLETVEGERRVEAERDLRRVVSALGDDVSIEADAYVGRDPADAIVDVSDAVDLLVLGSRGYGPVRAVLLGSVSRRVTAGAYCPVVVLPRGVEAALEALVTEAPGTAAPA